jgi:histidyl-tRNA synthetase
MGNQINNLNIESLIVKVSYELVSEKILDKNQINKLLGVLASNGVYAMWVYALDKFDNEEKQKNLFEFLKKIAELDRFITQSLSELINGIENKELERLDKITKYFTKYFIDISNDLHNLLFLKQILEKTLIYAYYHARAQGED